MNEYAKWWCRVLDACNQRRMHHMREGGKFAMFQRWEKADRSNQEALHYVHLRRRIWEWIEE